MFRYIPFDPFDNFFGFDRRDRRQYPKRVIKSDDSDNNERQVAPFGGYPNFLERWYDDFGDFKELEDVLKVKEEEDKYLVKVKDKNASLKDLLVNYHKKENELEVTISHNYERNDGENRSFTSSSSQTSRLGFDKAVKFEEITADVGEEGVIITVPKAEVDSGNVVKININRAREEGKL